MEGSSPEPETLWGLDAIDTCPPSGSDSRRRPKGASHGRAYGLDDILTYYDVVICLVLTCIIGTLVRQWGLLGDIHGKSDAVLITSAVCEMEIVT